MPLRPSALPFLSGLFLLAAVLNGCAETPKSSEVEPPPAPEAVVVDYHVHLLSPRLVHDWKSLGVPFSKPDEAYTSASGLLEPPVGKDPVQFAVLVPMAHLYGREEFRQALGLSEAEEIERVQGENDHLAREAARFPGRAVAFCGVDFLRPYAWDEIHRCRGQWGSPGIKLHLASAGAELRNPEHLEALARIAAWAEREGVLLMIHFDPQQRGLEVEDVEHFIATVLQPYPDLTLLVPHLGGSGGYGPWTQAVFGTFLDWLEAEAAAGRPRSGVSFDLSAAWLEEESEGIPASTEEDAAALRRDLRRAGVERIVFGSDYPVFDPRTYAARLRAVLDLAPEEWNAILQNRLPGLAPWPRPGSPAEASA